MGILLVGDVEQDTVKIPRVLKRPEQWADASTATAQHETPARGARGPGEPGAEAATCCWRLPCFWHLRLLSLVFQSREVSCALGVFRGTNTANYLTLF